MLEKVKKTHKNIMLWWLITGKEAFVIRFHQPAICKSNKLGKFCTANTTKFSGICIQPAEIIYKKFWHIICSDDVSVK